MMYNMVRERRPDTLSLAPLPAPPSTCSAARPSLYLIMLLCVCTQQARYMYTHFLYLITYVHIACCSTLHRPADAVWVTGLVANAIGSVGLYSTAGLLIPLSLLAALYSTLLVFNLIFSRCSITRCSTLHPKTQNTYTLCKLLAAWAGMYTGRVLRAFTFDSDGRVLGVYSACGSVLLYRRRHIRSGSYAMVQNVKMYTAHMHERYEQDTMCS